MLVEEGDRALLSQARGGLVVAGRRLRITVRPRKTPGKAPFPFRYAQVGLI